MAFISLCAVRNPMRRLSEVTPAHCTRINRCFGPPLEKLEAFKKRMGWNFKWVSAFNTDFNYDYHVSVRPEEPKANKVYYNYREIPPFGPECHGISVFYKDENRDVFHTYSTHARGLDMLNTAYHYLDLVPKGRDEDGPPGWVRHHDKYDD